MALISCKDPFEASSEQESMANVQMAIQERLAEYSNANPNKYAIYPKLTRTNDAYRDRKKDQVSFLFRQWTKALEPPRVLPRVMIKKIYVDEIAQAEGIRNAIENSIPTPQTFPEMEEANYIIMDIDIAYEMAAQKTRKKLIAYYSFIN